jgi:hypothetical protein
MHDEANPAITADRSGLASCSGLQHSEDKSALHGAITYVCHRDRRHDWCWHFRRRQRRGTHSNCLFTSYNAGGMVITQAPLTCTAVTGDAVGRSAHLIDVGGQIKLSHSIQYIKHIAKSTFC